MRRRDLLGAGAAAGAALAGTSATAAQGAPIPPSPRPAAAPPPPPGTPPAIPSPHELPPPKRPLPVAELRPPEGPPIAPMPLAERLRLGVVPRRGLCSLAPGKAFEDTLITGTGTMMAEVAGHPFAERVLFHHERLMLPWRRPFEAPDVAYVLPEVRRLLLAGKYREGLDLAFKAMNDAGLPMNTKTHPTIPAFALQIETAAAGPVQDYCRTLDFESGEAVVQWRDGRGRWLRRTFASRPDEVVVQQLTAPPRHTLDVRIALQRPPVGQHIGPLAFAQHNTPERLVFTGRFDPSVDDSGYAGVTRLVRDGGQARLDGDVLVVEGARSLTLLTRIEWFEHFSEAEVARLAAALDAAPADPEALLARHRAWQAPIIRRVSLDLGGAAQQGLAGEELLGDQRTRTGYAPALLERIFDMGRYWLLISSGRFPVQPMAGEVNININLQIAHGVLGDVPEAMVPYYDWIESLLPDCRENARRTFGARGAVYPILPNKGMGVSFLYAATEGGGIWPHPYWISAGGWCYSPFWDHYLATGDETFLRDRIVPGLKELALFYEDFLSLTDARGDYIFAPSFSPENWPLNAEPLPPPVWPLTTYDAFHMAPPAPLVINSAMDVMVCRQVLTHLIEACETLKIEAEGVRRWRGMLEKMPPYLVTEDGTLKEWGWPGLDENYDQRHVSHLYGAWPADEIDPRRTPELARAALLGDRKRGPSNSSAHGLCHRALAGARLKDSYLVNFELKQMLEQGYFGPTLRSSHNPYHAPMPDAQGGVPTILMEMLCYSRPGMIELLPALPESLRAGSISGMRARCFTKIDQLAWDLDARTLTLKLTSERAQEISLFAWHGVASLSAQGARAVAEGDAYRLHLRPGATASVSIRLRSSTPQRWRAA